MTSQHPQPNGWNPNPTRARINHSTFPKINRTRTTTPTTESEEGRGNVTSTDMDVRVVAEDPREAYYRDHYSLQTGIRIATTLGSFFLIVLITLVYKSKCKKHSRVPTPQLLEAMDMEEQQQPHPLVHLNQIHPFNHCPQQQLHQSSYPHQLSHPAVLLTSANSESSDDEGGGGLKTPGHRKSIDIHVILPTPTISPSNSEQHFRNNHAPFPGFLLENLKYVDDTSSENIPAMIEDDQGSIGSDSVFVMGGYEPPPPPLPPRRVSTYSGLSVSPSAYGYAFSETHAEVHRDSFSSDVEEYMEDSGGSGSGASGRRRSSSTQTTLSDLQHCLNLVAGGGSGSPRLSPSMALRPRQYMSLKSPSSGRRGEWRGSGPGPGPGGGKRKRSFDTKTTGEDNLMMMKTMMITRAQPEPDYEEDEDK